MWSTASKRKANGDDCDAPQVNHREVRDLISALRATGASRWEAIGMAATALGPDSVRGRWRILLARTDRRDQIMEALNEVARNAPEVANDWLGDALLKGKLPPADVAGRLQRLTAYWIRWLPEGVAYEGDLEVGPFLETLPNNLRVSGDLWLEGSAIRTLPAGMDIGGFLIIRNCASWDGTVPTDARVAMAIVSDGHPFGATLNAWRRAHPSGSERA